MKVIIDKNGFAPTRAHRTDAGLDLYSPRDFVVPADGAYEVDTGVHIELPHGTVGMLKSKSGLNIRHGIVSEGVVDEGYTGSIVVKLYNHSPRPYTVKKGDKITQLVVMPCLYESVDIVDTFDGTTERGDNGFGSSGR